MVPVSGAAWKTAVGEVHWMVRPPTHRGIRLSGYLNRLTNLTRLVKMMNIANKG